MGHYRSIWAQRITKVISLNLWHCQVSSFTLYCTLYSTNSCTVVEVKLQLWNDRYMFPFSLNYFEENKLFVYLNSIKLSLNVHLQIECTMYRYIDTAYVPVQCIKIRVFFSNVNKLLSEKLTLKHAVRLQIKILVWFQFQFRS